MINKEVTNMNKKSIRDPQQFLLKIAPSHVSVDAYVDHEKSKKWK